jgi:dynein heavy chain
VETNATVCLKSFILIKDAASADADHIIVNFRPELKEIIKETKYLDRIGFKLPEIALNIALQEDKYYGYVDQINQMLAQYHTMLDSMDSSEKKLMSLQIAELSMFEIMIF